MSSSKISVWVSQIDPPFTPQYSSVKKSKVITKLDHQELCGRWYPTVFLTSLPKVFVLLHDEEKAVRNVGQLYSQKYNTAETYDFEYLKKYDCILEYLGTFASLFGKVIRQCEPFIL